jgi:hypothetical protein
MKILKKKILLLYRIFMYNHQFGELIPYNESKRMNDLNFLIDL